MGVVLNRGIWLSRGVGCEGAGAGVHDVGFHGLQSVATSGPDYKLWGIPVNPLTAIDLVHACAGYMTGITITAVDSESESKQSAVDYRLVFVVVRQHGPRIVNVVFLDCLPPDR